MGPIFINPITSLHNIDSIIMNVENIGKGLFNIAIEQPVTLRERIYVHLRDAIINNHLPPGQRIYDKDIAKMFKVSITPVREALLQLNMEGFVEIDSYKQIFVKEVSSREINEIYDVQAVIEGLAAKLAIPNMSDEHLWRMEKLIARMSKCLESNEVNKFYEVNEQIHDLYVRQSNSQLICDLISHLNLRKRMFRYRVTFLPKKKVMKKAINIHKNILKAFLSRDPERVERTIIEHWKHWKNNLEK